MTSSGEAAGVPDGPGPLLLSVSGLGRLTHCERKFLANRDVEDDGSRGFAAMLGTLIHQLAQEHLFRRDWVREWERQLMAEPFWTPEYEPPALFAKAHWLMERYETVYAQDPLTGISAEVPFDLPLPGMEDVRIRGYIDGLASGPSGLVLLELKSMGRWGKAERAGWEPQCHTYLWAARQLGLPVTGCIFRAIYTGHKHDAEKPVAAHKSFRDVWVPYDQHQIDLVLDDYRRAARRANHIIAHPEDAVRNVGEGCTYCPFKFGCILPA